jgi:CubicO group peptidase (beta-lactamase class C family)
MSSIFRDLSMPLQSALTNLTAGYSLRLRLDGVATLAMVDWNWAKEPQDGRESWTPDVRMHVASLSKIVTAIAMTKLLNDKGMSYDTPIIDFLPGYWSKGFSVHLITFRQLMTHTSGLAFGNTSSRSDYEFMKEQVAGGTTHLGQYSYQNMNFGLCRILISSGTIMSQADAQTVLDDGFGINWTVTTPLGTYYAKIGTWSDGSGHMEPSIAFYLPQEMELVLFVNSPVALAAPGQLLSYGDIGTPGNVSDPVIVGFGGWTDFKFLFAGRNLAGQDRIYGVWAIPTPPPGESLYSVVSSAYTNNIVEQTVSE